jgi:hypothetical protein
MSGGEGETRIVVRLDCGHEILEVRGPTGEQELAELGRDGGRLACPECGRDRAITEFFAVEP